MILVQNPLVCKSKFYRSQLLVFFFIILFDIIKTVITMKVLIYENKNYQVVSKSGLAKAIKNQKKALMLNNIEYTTNINDDYDIVHINFYDPGSLIDITKFKKKKIPVVCHAHSTEEDFKNSFIFSNQIAPAFKLWLTNFYNNGDVIITPTPYSKSLLQAYKIKPNIIALSNGIDIKEYKTQRQNVAAFNQAYNLKQSDQLIISIGHLMERKGILDFIQLAETLPQYKFMWIGHTSDKLITTNVKNAIKKAPNNCIFTGFLEFENVLTALTRANLFLFASYEETEGIVVLEAMAMKVPVLLRNIPVYQEWIIDDFHAYKANNNDEFRQYITNILNKELPNLTKNAYHMVKEKDLKIIGRKLISIYQTTLEKVKLTNK